MKKVREYRQRARECREQAASESSPDVRRHYENMATVWDKLAEERLRFFVAHPEEDVDREVAEDAGGVL